MIKVIVKNCHDFDITISVEPTLLPVDVDEPAEDLIEFAEEPAAEKPGEQVAEESGDDGGGFFIEVTGARVVVDGEEENVETELLDDEPAEDPGEDAEAIEPAGIPPDEDDDPIAMIMAAEEPGQAADAEEPAENSKDEFHVADEQYIAAAESDAVQALKPAGNPPADDIDPVVMIMLANDETVKTHLDEVAGRR